jgi:hypothetical protein
MRIETLRKRISSANNLQEILLYLENSWINPLKIVSQIKKM